MREDQRTKFDWVRAIADPNVSFSASTHHVAVTLAGHLNLQGQGWVTQGNLAVETRLSERTVCSALKQLVDARWLQRTPGRQGRATTYDLTWPPGWAPTPKEVRPTRPTAQPRTPTDPSARAEALAVVKRVLHATGGDESATDRPDEAMGRLIWAMMHQLSLTPSGSPEMEKVVEMLSESDLTGAKNEGAVLLARYRQVQRSYPHLGQGMNTSEASDLFQRTLECLAANLSSRQGDAT